MQRNDWPWATALFALLASLFEFHLTLLETLIVVLVTFFLARKVVHAMWLETPAGQAYQAEVARQQAEAARIAREQYIVNMRAIITDEFRERTGDPYAEVPEAWMLYRWNELEREAAANARHAEVLDQQESIAFRRSLQDAFQTDMIVRAVHHEEDPNPRFRR